MIVVWLFLAMPWVGLKFVIVVFTDHTHLLSSYVLEECCISQGGMTFPTTSPIPIVSEGHLGESGSLFSSRISLYTIQSSAKSLKLDLTQAGRSLIKTRKSIDPNTLPWETGYHY